MANNLTEKLKSVATGKNVVIFIVPAYIIYFLMIFYTIPKLDRYLPESTKIFDLSPLGYSYEYAMKLLGSLGETGRDVYLYQQLPLDFIYPALFAISSCLLMAWLFTKAKVSSTKLYYLSIAPVIAGVMDYLENIQLIKMLLNYPNLSEQQVALASFFTVSKSGLTTLFFIVLIGTLIRLAMIKFITGKQKRE